MHPPTQTERQALDAAIGAIAGDSADPIVLTPIAAKPGDMRWSGAGCTSWFQGSQGHHFQRIFGNRYAITWFGEEKMVDQHGRVWSREFDAVIDDFGNLVEVQR